MHNIFYNILIALALFIGIFSCTSSENTESFTREHFHKHSDLYAETIDIKTEKLINPIRLTVVHDSILLIQNDEPTEYFIDVYNINSNKLIHSIAPKGKGPDEFLRGNKVLYNRNSEHFWIRDLVMWRLSRYHIDSMLNMGIKYRPTHFKGTNYAKEITEFDENNFIYFNKYQVSEEKYSNKNIEKLYLKKKVSPREKETESFEWKNYPANVTGANINLLPNKNNFLVTYYYEDKIEIYDKSLNLLKTLIGPDHFEPKYERAAMKQEMILHADNMYWRAYSSSFLTEDAIYVLFAGFNGVPYETVSPKPYEIFKIGWNGELLHHYKLDSYVYIITLDSNSKYIYGCKQNSYDETPQLVRFKL